MQCNLKEVDWDYAQTIGGKMQLCNKNLMFLQYTWYKDDTTYHGCFLVLQKLLLFSYW